MIKKIFLFLLSLFLVTFSFQSYAITSLFNNSNEIMYCKSGDCSLEKGTQMVKAGINDIEKNRKASVYIQDVVRYLLTFVTVVAVLYVIYAGFKVLTSAGNEDEVKKSKTTIVSVLIGIVIMWLAYSIVSWILKVIVGI